MKKKQCSYYVKKLCHYTCQCHSHMCIHIYSMGLFNRYRVQLCLGRSIFQTLKLKPMNYNRRMQIGNKSVLIRYQLYISSLYQITDIDISKSLHFLTDICQQPLETCGATFKCAGLSASVLEFKSSEKNQIKYVIKNCLYCNCSIWIMPLLSSLLLQCT